VSRLLAGALAAVAISVAWSLGAPAEADALVGAPTAPPIPWQEVVLTPGGETVSVGAQNYLARLAEHSAQLDGLATDRGLSSLLAGNEGLGAAASRAGMLPRLAAFAVNPWTAVGAVGAYFACKELLGGCWLFGDGDGAKSPASGFTWTRSELGVGTITGPVWILTNYPGSGFGVRQSIWQGQGGFPGDCTGGLTSPGVGAWTAEGGSGSANCGGAYGVVTGQRGSYVLRDDGLVKAQYGGATAPTTGQPATGNYWNCETATSGPQPSTPVQWRCLARALQEEYPKVGQNIGAAISDRVKPAGSGTVGVPNCSGLLWSGCKRLMESWDLDPVRAPLGFQGAYVDKPGSAVIRWSPGPGVEVGTGTVITVVTNPDPELMPLVMPELPEDPNETYQHYVELVEAAGFPSPAIVVNPTANPGFGPSAVTGAQPQPGSRVDPQSNPTATVNVNPADAPPAAGGGIASPSLTPLGEVEIPCTKFPFGVFCWIYEGLGGWSGDAACSGDTGALNLNAPFKSNPSGSTDTAIPFKLCMFDPAVQVFRPVLLLLAVFCLAWFFSSAAMGLGGSEPQE
jgi:hypothetical protein